MRILFMALILGINFLYSSTDEIKKIDYLIHYNSKHNLKAVKYDPFFKAQKVIKKAIVKKKQSYNFFLSSILNNKAFIGSKWYGVGDKINNFKIIAIEKDAILAKKNRKIIKIGFYKSKKLLRVKEK